MYSDIKPGCIWFFIPILVIVLYFNKCRSDRNNVQETGQEVNKTAFKLPRIFQKEVDNNTPIQGYAPNSYRMPKKRKKSIGDRTYPMLDFGVHEWMGRDLNYDVPDSYLYNNKKRGFYKNTRFYSQETARTLCEAFGMTLPSAKDWLDLLVFAGGHSGDNYSSQGFHQHRAFGKLTVSDGLGFDVNTNGFGYKDSQYSEEAYFTGKNEITYYWTSSYDHNYPSHPIVIAFDRSTASVVRYRVSNSNTQLYACRCIIK